MGACGQANVVADALSRGLCPPNIDSPEVCDALATKIITAIQNPPDSDWLVELATDPAYSEIISTLRQLQNHNARLDTSKLSDGHCKLKYSDFVLDEGFLWVIAGEEQPRRVVPSPKCREIFTSAHEGACSDHFAARKIYKILKISYYWAMARDICGTRSALNALSPTCKKL